MQFFRWQFCNLIRLIFHFDTKLNMATSGCPLLHRKIGFGKKDFIAFVFRAVRDVVTSFFHQKTKEDCGAFVPLVKIDTLTNLKIRAVHTSPIRAKKFHFGRN